MRIACVGYRDWALAIYDHIATNTDHTVFIMRRREQCDPQAILDFAPDIALFYGWSWKVGPELLDSTKCIMLHPSALPHYRGGSPIQNQIIDGVRDSKVTLFVMTEGMDEGDIVAQAPLSLRGHLEDIFVRLTEIGIALTEKILAEGLATRPQDNSQATYCRRRTQEESEITPDDLASKPAQFLFDKIRMLEDPYPNAFIRTSDGRRLLIKRAEVD